MNKSKTYYYKSETEDFVGQNIKKIDINEEYKYINKNFFWKIVSFIVYRIIAMPIAFIYCKFVFNLKFVNKKVLKKCKDSGYFTYSNHTHKILDTFIPTLANFPRKCQIIAHPDNVAIPFLGTFNKMMGAFPIPSNIGAMKKFLSAMEFYLDKKNVITVYPEAHVWPYYTKIRDFAITSFKYPVKLEKPIYTFTTTYRKRKYRRPKVVVYIDGPFYANKTLSIKQAQQELRDKVYNTMCMRVKESNVEYYNYVKMDEDIGDKND